MDQANVMPWGIIIAVVFTIIGVIVAIMIIAPIYGVWVAHKNGEADLARARNEQQIQIAQAESRLKAAEMNKKAAIVEAEAVAAQIKTIGQNLTEHDLYLKWQWINMMEKNEGDKVIYVPTEANLPILEARRKV